MKYIYLAVVFIGLMATSCHSTKSATSSNTETVTTTKEVKPFRVEKEKVVAATGEDASVSNHKYYIIWGSFQHQENAKKLKTELIEKYQAQACILVNEAGWYRVCFENFNKEKKARERITALRVEYPNFEEMWLLINKK